MSPNIDVIREIMIQRLSPWLVYLFGSASTGRMRTDSDFDLAFCSDVVNSDYEVFMTAQALADKLGREVDLVDLSKASEVFRAEIVRSRKIIFERDRQRRYWFETNVLEAYALLNERRKPVLDRIKERGTIYD